MDQRHEKAWQDEQAAHRVARNEAWAAVARAARKPGQWLAQAAELLIWGFKLVSTALVVAVILLCFAMAFQLKLPNAGDTALAIAGPIVGLMLPFASKLWPTSPFRTIWLATYQEQRLLSSRKNG